MRSRALSILLVTVSTAACAEVGLNDRGASQLDEARRALERKDLEVRAYQWQLGMLAQQLREGQARSDALQRELFAQVQQLTAQNASLAERLKKAESDRAALAAAPGDAVGRGQDARSNVEALRRVLAASDAHNAQIAEELARIAKILGAKPPADAGTPRTPAGIDVVDPWGFGSRK
jgi:hypothetical protein